VDWEGFTAYVVKTAESGLIPAVNMDTGYVNLIDAPTRIMVLKKTWQVLGGKAFVAETVITNGDTDFVGYGRMVLSYPEFTADVLSGNALQKNKICRTFSDCTTAPRLGLVSGCFPLDEYYRSLPDYDSLEYSKKQTNK